jgi:hypothetical protein
LEISSKPDEFLLFTELTAHTVAISVIGIYIISGKPCGK